MARAAVIAASPMRCAQFGGDRRRRRFLDHLLMAALDRAIALAEMDDVAVLVGKDLDFDVAGVGDRPLQDQLVRTEGARRLGARPRQRVGEIARREATSRMPRPPPPAAALTISGKPMRRPSAVSVVVGLIGP